MWSIYFNTPQHQSDYLKDWLPWRGTYLKHLLEIEGRPGDGICDHCHHREGIFHCLDCLGDLIWCKNCCLKLHHHIPFHRILEWSGKYFFKSSLQKLGYIIQLGHRGHPCPNASTTMDSHKNNKEDTDGDSAEDNDSDGGHDMNDMEMVIINTNGVF